MTEERDATSTPGMAPALDDALEGGRAEEAPGAASLDLFRVYGGEIESIGQDGYPLVWHCLDLAKPGTMPGLKDLVREQAGNRCVRCGHPYAKGERLELDAASGKRISWSPCDEECRHYGVVRITAPDPEDEWGGGFDLSAMPSASMYHARRGFRGIDAPPVFKVEAAWRILTVHHLNGIKLDCRWWNLAALCQRCHLTIQGKVRLDRAFIREHSEWFKPYAAGWYAEKYLGESLTREETMARLDELLAKELFQEALW